MPSVDPDYIDAVDWIIETKDGRAQWEDAEMRGALLEAEKGATLAEAAEGCDFSKGTLSDVKQRADAKAEELRQSREEGSGLFRDPIEEAIEEFRAFFDEMNDKYEMGISDVSVQMMVDEIEDAGQLPRAAYVGQFLSNTSSGVNNQGDLQYITRRYRQWLEGFKESQNTDTGAGGTGGIGGTDVSRGGRSIPSSGGGVDVSGGGALFPDEGGQREPESDDRVDRLEKEINELKSLIREDNQQSGGGDNITIERENAPDVTVPANHPMVTQMMDDGSGDSGDDMMEFLSKAKEAGLVVGPEQIQEMQDSGSDFEEMLERLTQLGVVDTGGGDEMAKAIQNAISDLGQKQLQAQQQMSQNLQQVMSEMKEMQEDDDEDITLEDVESVIEDKLTEDETDRLRREMDERFNQLADKVDDSRRRSRGGQDDPEVLKAQREYDYRETQLETLNENLRDLPKSLAMSVREGLVPAMKEMQSMDGSGGSDLWSPPGGGDRGGPSYTPEEVRDAEPAPRPEAEPAPEEEQWPTEPREPETQAQDAGYPEVEAEEPAEEDTDEAPPGQDGPTGVDAEDVQDLRDRLDLNDDADPQEAQ